MPVEGRELHRSTDRHARVATGKRSATGHHVGVFPPEALRIRGDTRFRVLVCRAGEWFYLASAVFLLGSGALLRARIPDEYGKTGVGAFAAQRCAGLRSFEQRRSECDDVPTTTACCGLGSALRGGAALCRRLRVFSPAGSRRVRRRICRESDIRSVLLEVGGGTVAAHGLIHYAGDPAAFAWMVRIPWARELALSHSSLCSWLEAATESFTGAEVFNPCPAPAFYCRQHPISGCPSPPYDPGCDEWWALLWCVQRQLGLKRTPATAGRDQHPVEVISREPRAVEPTSGGNVSSPPGAGAMVEGVPV